MSRIEWSKEGSKVYESGCRNGVLYTKEADGYAPGVAWNGLLKVKEAPSGAEATPLYADDTKYLSLMSAEEFGASIEAYTYPDEFMECDGSAEIATGITIGQQSRKPFGLVYRTMKGNDTAGDRFGYKLHIIYGAQASPSEKEYSTINDSPEAITFSWEITTTPVNVTGFRPTANLIIDSTTVTAEQMTKIETALFGSAETEPTLLLPDEILELIKVS